MTIYNTSNAESVDPATSNDHGEAGPTQSDSRPTGVMAMTRDQVRQVLGFDDTHSPGWIRSIHEYKVSTFGSGNGQVVR